MKNKNNTVRISKLVVTCVILSFLVVILKLSIVIFKPKIDGLDLSKFASNRNTAKEVLFAQRGSIYDVGGELLAKNVNSYTVIAYLMDTRTTDESNPQHVVDKEYTAKMLSPILNMTEEYILSLLNKNLYQVELGPNGRNITELTKEEIEALDLPGISFIISSKRTYQMGNFASYIIGYAKANQKGKITGEMGIEEYFDKQLTGVDGYIEYQKDTYGYRIPNTPALEKAAVSGKDIYLTIDSDIQMFLENAMSNIALAAPMAWGTISIIDGKSGAILGSVSNPSFNLNDLNIENYLNPLVSYQYEPGSTMKVFSFLASMEAGQYNEKATYKSGTIAVADAVIQDYNNGNGWGKITFDDGFARSSNVAAAILGLNLGAEKLKTFYQSAGFGTKTGINLPGEVAGSINIKYKTEIATASFGQGITTTPIQTLQAATILTNDGVMLKPYIVDKIVDSQTNKVVFTGAKNEIRQVASSQNIQKIKTLMNDAVYKDYTEARFYKPTTVTIAGKTGTAQIAAPGGGYLSGGANYIRSFIGIFPYENPQYIIYVSFKQYEGAHSTIAKNVAAIIDEIAKTKNIVDNNQNSDLSKIITLASYINADTQKAVTKINNLHLVPIVIGSGSKIINQYPNKGTSVVEGTKIFIITNKDDYQMPNVIGWSANEITTYCKLIGLDYKITGYGKVSATNIAEGIKIDESSLLLITLTRN